MFRLSTPPSCIFVYRTPLTAVGRLLTHQGRFQGAFDVSRRSVLALNVAGTYGDVDYLTLRELIGARQSAIPLVDKFYTLESNLDFGYRLSRSVDLIASMSALRRVPTGVGT